MRTVRTPAMSQGLRGAIVGLGLLGCGIAAQAATTMWAGTSIGLFKSIDGGAGWQFVTITNSNPLLQGTAEIMAVALDPQQPATIYFAAAVGNTAGFFKSADNGNTWSAATLTGTSLSQGQTWLAIDPVLTNVIYLSSDTLRKSTDYGASWSVVNIAGVPPLSKVSVLIQARLVSSTPQPRRRLFRRASISEPPGRSSPR